MTLNLNDGTNYMSYMARGLVNIGDILEFNFTYTSQKISGLCIKKVCRIKDNICHIFFYFYTFKKSMMIKYGYITYLDVHF